MSLINKDLITQLTKDGLKSLMINRTKKGIFQVYGLEKIVKKDGAGGPVSDKYRYFLPIVISLIETHSKRLHLGRRFSIPRRLWQQCSKNHFEQYQSAKLCNH